MSYQTQGAAAPSGGNFLGNQPQFIQAPSH